MAAALGLVVAGAAVALLAGGRAGAATPGVSTVPGPGGAQTGAGAPAALALVALAGAGAALLVRNKGRIALGCVLLVIGAALVAVGLTPTRWAALTAGALVVAGALLVVLRARRWPQPRSRFEAPVRTGTGGPTGSPRDAWDALDRGEDPTD
jgi:tryptophan-associated transmembrane protein